MTMNSNEMTEETQDHTADLSFRHIASLSTREIHERNENAMSLLSTLANASAASLPATEPPRKLSAMRPEDVQSEGQNAATAVRPHHIVKIFTGDDGFIEVTPQQVKRIKVMHDSIDESVSFSFNYNTLLLVASVLAGLGLVADSGTTVIASMLVSPIMGPVVGLAYGTTIRDWNLVRKSLRNETLSLAFCIGMGMVIGACTGPSALSDEWPTSEMSSRGDLQNFFVALPVAFFSGLGVAVSILDEQTASLVGVAISASLLPPAVDAGILWIAYAFTKSGVITPMPLPAPAQTGQDGDDGEEEYSKTDYRQMGAIALGVTLANIILIWISGMLMFRMKEVLPIKKKVFWDDLKVTRRIYQRRALLQVVEVEGNDDDEQDASGSGTNEEAGRT